MNTNISVRSIMDRLFKVKETKKCDRNKSREIDSETITKLKSLDLVCHGNAIHNHRCGGSYKNTMTLNQQKETKTDNCSFLNFELVKGTYYAKACSRNQICNSKEKWSSPTIFYLNWKELFKDKNLEFFSLEDKHKGSYKGDTDVVARAKTGDPWTHMKKYVEYIAMPQPEKDFLKQFEKVKHKKILYLLEHYINAVILLIEGYDTPLTATSTRNGQYLDKVIAKGIVAVAQKQNKFKFEKKKLEYPY